MPPIRTVIFAVRKMAKSEVLIEGPESPLSPHKWFVRRPSTREAEITSWRDVDPTGNDFGTNCPDDSYIVMMGMQDGIPKVRLGDRAMAKKWLQGKKVGDHPAIKM